MPPRPVAPLPEGHACGRWCAGVIHATGVWAPDADAALRAVREATRRPAMLVGPFPGELEAGALRTPEGPHRPFCVWWRASPPGDPPPFEPCRERYVKPYSLPRRRRPPEPPAPRRPWWRRLRSQ